MRSVLSISISSRVYSEIERLRGREKRSTFVEHLLNLGLKEYMKNKGHSQNEQHTPKVS